MIGMSVTSIELPSLYLSLHQEGSRAFVNSSGFIYLRFYGENKWVEFRNSLKDGWESLQNKGVLHN